MSVVANVAINVDSRNAVSQLRQVETRAQATQKAFGALQQAAAAFGAGFALSRVIADVRELDTNLRRLGTVGGDVRALDKGLGALSKQLDGVANKAELAAASYQALSAGFVDTAGNIKIVEAATKAAVGGLADTTQVTAVLTKTLNAYSMTGSDAIKVTDSISKAVEFGQVEWSDYTSQLGRVASIAAIAGVSLDEVNAFIAAATKNGATAEIAFTGLGATLNSLLQPTKESQDAAKVLGIQWNLAGLQGKGFDGLIAELAQKMGTNQEAAVRLLGSQEALRGAFAAAAKGGKDYQAALEAIGGAAGKTDKDFQAMKTSLENQLKALDTAFKNLSEALGKAFGPTVVLIIQDITSAINGLADIVNAIPQPIANMAGAVAKAVLQVVLLQKAIEGIVALRMAVTAMFATTAAGATASAAAASGLTMNMRYLQGSMAAAQTQASGLVAVLRNLAAFGVITVGINLVVTGLQEALAAAAETRRLRGERGAGGAAAIYGGSATKEQKATAQKTLQAIRSEQNRYKQPGTIAAQTLLGPASQLFGVPTTAQAGARRTVLGERALRAEATMALPTRIEKPVVTPDLPTPPPTPTEDDKKKDKGAKELAQLEARVRGIKMQTEATKQLSLIQDKISQAEIAGDAQLAIRLKGEERNQQILLDYQKSLEGVTSEKEKQALFAGALADLDASRANTERELNLQAVNRTKTIEQTLSGLDQEIERAKAITDDQKLKVQFNEIENQLKSQNIVLSEAEANAIKKKLGLLNQVNAAQAYEQQQIQQLNNLYQGLAGTVANGFGRAFDAAISGSENLGKAMQNLAADIMQTVTKMLIMYAIGAALKALAGGKADDKGGILTFLAGAFGAKADGGAVKASTPYLVGERGPELFVPSANGGVMSNSDLRSTMGSAPGSSSGPVLNMSFETTNIGGVEYVSRDQLEAAMAATRRQAARDGAKRGMDMTLDRLQQSPSTRNRVGLR